MTSHSNDINYFDYKDTGTLKKFLNQHGRILSRRRSELPAKSQRVLAEVVKRARFLGLLPFVSR